MSAASTATTLQHLLEAEGAVIHAALQARALPSMGGGVGMILTKRLPPGSTLAQLPFRSMITAQKARFNLAMAEVALELREEKCVRAAGAQGGPCASVAEDDPFPVVSFTSRVWPESEFESRVRSQNLRSAITVKVEELKGALDSTETIVCYILLMAALHGRWQVGETSSRTRDTARDDEQASESTTQSHPTVLRYTHENRWMRTWIHALPMQYDNLLELAPQQSNAPAALDDDTASSAVGHSLPLLSTSSSSPVPLLPLKTSYTTSPEWLHSYVSLARFRASTMREQRLIEQRYHKCCAALRCLRNMPIGEEVDVSVTAQTTLAEEPEGDARRDGQLEQTRTASPSCHAQHGEGSHASLWAHHRSEGASRPSLCTLGHFLWAFNTLMSRGFFFPEETWALMPFVDYFNYALDSNGTMFPQQDDPHDASSISSRSLSKVSPAPMPTAAPRRQAHRTGLRSARVGRDVIPLANYISYKFQLMRPVYAAGEQVMLHYGAYSDMELLMWYGFTLRPSLLPTSCVSSEVIETCDEACDDVMPLPPGLADADRDQVLLHTARALRVLLPQVVCADTRVAYYRQHIQRPGAFAAQRTSNEEQPSRTVQDEIDEDNYNSWTTALQRAYSLPLSPLADAEGNYPPVVRGQLWIDALLLSFAQTPPLEASCSDAPSASHAAACGADAWMRQWIAQRWPQFAETAFPRVAKDCGFGVLGLSPLLHAAITSSFWVPSQQEEMDKAEQMHLVRGIAWAELYVNAKAVSLVKPEVPRAPTGAAVSAAAAAFAQIVSVDQWALLAFLALGISDAALEEYVAYESEVG
ncbi:hypothetical protein ABL78_2971 [Leptomonas seymouri]|uniref:SET domain-containing protein n=1 Tax=Leptomonas seymouri TaxID=5684 RepID=A0A0N1I059_LEPSE|nr:hypothetical protein ABL78_2971 [Leptomonas seymouri]|eukprot:KPI87932.1 hypothetical protein ABL78_2971 [Leptomonas seymouri]